MLIESQFCDNVVFINPVKDEVKEYILTLGLTVLSKINYTPDVQKKTLSLTGS